MIGLFLWRKMPERRVWLFLPAILLAENSLRKVWLYLDDFFLRHRTENFSNYYFRLFYKSKAWELFNTYQTFLRLFFDWIPWFACSARYADPRQGDHISGEPCKIITELVDRWTIQISCKKFHVIGRSVVITANFLPPTPFLAILVPGMYVQQGCEVYPAI